jgi:hypothetical protein
MTASHAAFDLAAFQREVDRVLPDLDMLSPVVLPAGVPEQSIDPVALAVGRAGWLNGRLGDYFATPGELSGLAYRVFEQLRAHQPTKAQLCAGLRSTGNDAFETSKIVVGVLVPLIIAGTLTIPLSPVLFAFVSLVLARSGVAGFCADVPEPKK